MPGAERTMRDVVIMGGGPGGLTLGCYLADAGIAPLIVERLNHPRPHVGESLMPSTLRVAREIGFLGIVEDAGFPCSEGVVYRPQAGDDVVLPYTHFPPDDVEQTYTYHVDRSRFDMLLMKHAESKGCTVVQGVAVDRVLFDGDRAYGVQLSVGGRRLDIEARIVVDAAGRATRIGRQLGIRRDHPKLDHFALHGWFTGVDLGAPETARYTHVFFLPEVRGWAWQAPIDDTVTSVGLVAARSKFLEAGQGVEDFFSASTLELNPKLSAAMRHAERVNELGGEVGYSYSLDRVCGDGWLAIGDAARFLDPVFSSGVSVAMHTARSAAERIEAAVRTERTSREVFLPYEDSVLTGAAIWDDFIRLFYRLLPAFTHLLESDVHRDALTRMIQGDVHERSDAEWLAEMRAMVRKVEEADSHPWKDQLMDLSF